MRRARRSSRRSPRPTRRSRIRRSAPPTTSSAAATSPGRISGRRPIGSSSSAAQAAGGDGEVLVRRHRSRGPVRGHSAARRRRGTRSGAPMQMPGRGLRGHRAPHARGRQPRHAGRPRASACRNTTSTGRLRRVPKTFKARIPKGATDGQRLRLRGQGRQGRERRAQRRPVPQHRAASAPAVPRRRPRPLPRPAARAVGGGARRRPSRCRRSAGAVNLKVPPGTARGTQAAPREARACPSRAAARATCTRSCRS